MANIKDYIKKVMDGTVSLEEQQQALAQVEQTIREQKQIRDENIGKSTDLVIQALRKIEDRLNNKYTELLNTPAMKGEPGPQGKAGKDGKDGLNGRDGINGKDGKDGIDGVDGQDGVSVVDAKIDFDGSLVIYLSNGDEIDAGKVLSEETASQIIINSGSGGTSQAVLDTLASLQSQIDTLTGIDGVLGDMAQQTSSAVSITGGAINNTPIGATTPSTGSFTTLTAQTEVLNGTGQNLWLQSQNFGTTWIAVASSVPALDSTTAPDGTNTADTWTINGTTAQHYIQQSATYVAGISYTFSIYVKKNTGNFIQIGGASGQFGTNAYANFNINTGVVGTVGSAATATITSVGNSWYRCTITAPCTTAGTGNSFFGFIQSATDARLPSFAGNSTDSLYLWGGQLEISSSVGTYTATTTTAVYGTPSLSFSGVAGIGLQSDGSLYHQPAGTGAVQAQATTSSATGGNARGANAVDWQTSRTAATQVASGTYTAIAGGQNNTAVGSNSFIGAGLTNTCNAAYGMVIGGFSNSASNSYATIVGGSLNTAGGFFNFIGGGANNAGTAAAAVTTQATTTVTNGSTAVTLSGSNAAIKVGQLIAGTGIAGWTYVAAISGTSLTLSQNANATGTPTLSFYTPHGVVVGGGNNQATGSYSFIGGGGDAGTAAGKNTASGDWSVIGGGKNNTASGAYSVIGGGGGDGSSSVALGNTASGVTSTVSGGLSNTASGTGSTIVGGYQNTANGLITTVMGRYGTARSISGNTVFSANNVSIGSGAGLNQAALVVLAKATTDATATILTSDSGAAGTTNQVILPNNSAYLFKATVIAGVTGGGNTSGWKLEGVIKRGANAGSTAIVGAVTTTLLAQDIGAATWAVTATADTTNGGLKITVTGQAATTIRWVCKVETTEMTY